LVSGTKQKRPKLAFEPFVPSPDSYREGLEPLILIGKWYKTKKAQTCV
jgi:hypothetical protein